MDLNTSFTNVNQNGQNMIGDVPIKFSILHLPAMAIVAGKWQKVPETTTKLSFMETVKFLAFGRVFPIARWAQTSQDNSFTAFRDKRSLCLKLRIFWKIGVDGSHGSNQSGRLALSDSCHIFLQNEK